MTMPTPQPDPLSVWQALSGLKPGLVAIYGAGGKTSLLNHLANEAVATGRETIYTTTTHIFLPDQIELILSEDRSWTELKATLRASLAREGLVALAGRFISKMKLRGVEPVLLERLQAVFPKAMFVVEADGAAGRALKGYASHEPVLPPSSNYIFPVLGLSALGSPADSGVVHRPEHLLPVLRLSSGQTLTATSLVQAMLYLIRHGLEQAPKAEVIPIFNQSDRIEGAEAELLRATCAGLQDCLPVKKFIYTALQKNPPVRFFLERDSCTGCFVAPVCGVVLAAGLSKRMGCEKLALPFRGKTVLEHTIEQALAGGLREVIVVVRPDSPWSGKLAARPGVRVVVNPCFREGIATSLRAGLMAAAAGNQAVLFILGDQPLVSPAVYRALVAAYRNSPVAVVHPAYRGRRGNPVLFDRRTWSYLFQLQGDSGGRQIFPRLNPADINAIELDDPAVCMDLDCPEDYRCLREQMDP